MNPVEVKVGTQTKGAPSFTKGKANFAFHQKDLDNITIKMLESWFIENHKELHDKYLNRYKLDNSHD